MINRFSRAELLLGEEGIQKLSKKHVAVFGVGGVGGYTAEALARGGIGCIDIIDADVISLTNINRQIIALESTIGMPKVDALRERLLDINPLANITAWNLFFTAETSDKINFATYDYVVDAIDTVSGKLEIIARAKASKVSVISAMGAGNKLNPLAFRVADIAKTKGCPLARVMRRELSRRGISGVKAVYSEEEPHTPFPGEDEDTKGTAGRPTPGSVSFVPPVAGFILAGEVIKDLLLEPGGDYGFKED